MAFGYTPTGLLGTYLGNIRRPGSNWAKAGRVLTGLPSLLGQTMADPRFRDVIDRLAVSEQRAPADDVYHRAKAQEAYETAKAARAEQGRQAAFRQTIGDIERKSAIKQDVQRDIAARTAPESVRAEREALLQQELGPAAYQGVLPPSARRDARGKLTSTPGLLRKQPAAREIALTSGIIGFDQNRPVRSAVEPLAHQTSEYMTPGYVKSLMGPTAAEREILDFRPKRELAKAMTRHPDEDIQLAGYKEMVGSNLPASARAVEWLRNIQDPKERALALEMMQKALQWQNVGPQILGMHPTRGETVTTLDVGLSPEKELSYLEAAEISKKKGEYKVTGTPGEQEADKLYAALHVAWPQERSDVRKGLNALKEVRDLMGSRDANGNFVSNGNELTGRGYFGRPRSTLAGTDKGAKAMNALEKVEEVVQRNLRAVLGGQFAEREGVQLIKRAYNITLPEAYNFERLDALIDSVQEVYDSRNDTFEYWTKMQQAPGSLGGTLRGWVPRTMKIVVPEGGTGFHLEGSDLLSEAATLGADQERAKNFTFGDSWWIEESESTDQQLNDFFSGGAN